ncbi:pentapeptide repeat-containing protein [Candidatus Arsenophonus triatominarum]|uniref:pentapeptide repeat-containing protein n=1 Tax=Candidatus Arsenophonus triatominarum TaxID=57911 RepID=UPI0007C5BAAE|nr:pentapeptide repeat-containing protein [Candidatus Arsenophonus triatominarum]
MSYIKTNIDHYAKFMESNLGINDMDVKKATSPTTILEHIIDFITFGGVRKELTKQYNEFCSKIVDTLEQSNGLDRYEIPKKLKFNFLGKDVTFSNENDNVSINVQGKAAEKGIDEKFFNNFCTIQLLMKREGLSKNQAWLTNDGNICLANADLSNRDLSGIDLRGAQLHDVNLSNSDLSFSNLKGAQLQFTKLDSVCYDKQAERNTYMSNLCDYLKTTYQIDSEGKRNSKSDGLFRVAANHTDFLNAKKAFNEGNINFENHSVRSIGKILSDECKRISPIDDAMLVEMESGQEEFLSIFNKKVQSMIPEERKMFEMILGLYADAYDSAEDDKTSRFNKYLILTGSIYPSLFWGAEQILDIEKINKRKEFSKEIITSFKQLNDVELPVLHDNRNIHSESVEEKKAANEVDPSHARTRSGEFVKARKAFFENLTATNINNLKQPISTGALRDVTTLRKFFENNPLN